MIELKSKYPAYGKIIAERIKWNNLPSVIFVCLGGDAFRSAQHHNKDRDQAAMVLLPAQNPKQLIWPVKNIPVIIEWDGSASEKTIIDLARCLLGAGATSATIYPVFEDFSTQPGYYDTAQLKFINSREVIRTYHPKKVRNVA